MTQQSPTINAAVWLLDEDGEVIRQIRTYQLTLEDLPFRVEEQLAFDLAPGRYGIAVIANEAVTNVRVLDATFQQLFEVLPKEELDLAPPKLNIGDNAFWILDDGRKVTTLVVGFTPDITDASNNYLYDVRQADGSTVRIRENDLEFTTAPVWELSTWRTTGTGRWQPQPVLTVNFVPARFAHPQDYINELNSISRRGGEPADTLRNEIRAFQAVLGEFDAPEEEQAPTQRFSVGDLVLVGGATATTWVITDVRLRDNRWQYFIEVERGVGGNPGWVAERRLSLASPPDEEEEEEREEEEREDEEPPADAPDPKFEVGDRVFVGGSRATIWMVSDREFRDGRWRYFVTVVSGSGNEGWVGESLLSRA